MINSRHLLARKNTYRQVSVEERIFCGCSNILKTRISCRCILWYIIVLFSEPEIVLQHCSNAAWKVNDLGGKLRAKGLHLSIIVLTLYQINLFRSSKYEFILKFVIIPPKFDMIHNR